MSIITSSSAKVTTTPTTTTAPNFLARFPRSLSQLNIGNKRKSTTAASPQEPQKPASPASSSSSSNTPISSPNHQQKNNRTRHQHPTVTADVPPPLPQRNIPRKNSAQVSDLDASMMMAAAKATPEAVRSGSKKKNKQKAYSDPKMSSEMMMQMEASNLPPPLPPRTPGNSSNLEDGAFGLCVTNKDSFDGSSNGADGRPLPNSCSTQLHYPLITTSVAVRDGMLPPPNFHGHHHHQAQHSFESVMNTSSSSLPPDLQTAVSRQKMGFF